MATRALLYLREGPKKGARSPADAPVGVAYDLVLGFVEPRVRYVALHACPERRRRVDSQPAADGADAVVHVRDPGAGRRPAEVEASTSVADRETQSMARADKIYCYVNPPGVLSGVVNCG